MNRSILKLFCIFYLSITNCLSGKGLTNNLFPLDRVIISDSIQEDQILFNGRVWRNLYSQVEGDQFLFSKEFLTGTVTMRGKTFINIRIMYDIFKDEILIPYKPVGIIQINKEMVDSFSMFFLNKKYFFERVSQIVDEDINVFFNHLYSGKTQLYVRYIKKIEKLADGGKYDKFYQRNRIYLVKDGEFHIIRGKEDIFRIFSENKKAIRNYLRNSNIQIRRDDAESYVPLLKFIDSLTN